MMDEVERIVEERPELYNNRQQFIEAAIRRSIEKYSLEEHPKSNPHSD
ncbi:hypothetical protein GWN63_06385 [Candidatus Bathyarchaeota archaeon]|nr:hypothetical protein [Candidatus Bathyarchaeota archaeon]NIU81848.1 hypothetical protein [Candidatus Bathyarchaeota archaeon]NIW34989.1 hypothetical protein [Candidatus Bathyarchaeota archaeon]